MGMDIYLIHDKSQMEYLSLDMFKPGTDGLADFNDLLDKFVEGETSIEFK